MFNRLKKKRKKQKQKQKKNEGEEREKYENETGDTPISFGPSPENRSDKGVVCALSIYKKCLFIQTATHSKIRSFVKSFPLVTIIKSSVIFSS